MLPEAGWSGGMAVLTSASSASLTPYQTDHNLDQHFLPTMNQSGHHQHARYPPLDYQQPLDIYQDQGFMQGSFSSPSSARSARTARGYQSPSPEMDNVYPPLIPPGNIRAAAPVNPTPVAPPLPRNTACQSCKTKKLRCDAGKPHCRTCINTYNYKKQRANRSGKTVELKCWYADDVVGAGGSAGAVRRGERGAKQSVRKENRKEDPVLEQQLKSQKQDVVATSDLLELKELRELKDRMAHLERMLAANPNPTSIVPAPHLPIPAAQTPAPLDDLAALAAFYQDSPRSADPGPSSVRAYPPGDASAPRFTHGVEHQAGRESFGAKGLGQQDMGAEGYTRTTYGAIPQSFVERRGSTPPPPPPRFNAEPARTQTDGPKPPAQIQVGPFRGDSTGVHPYLEGYVFSGEKRPNPFALPPSSVAHSAATIGTTRGSNDQIYAPEYGTIHASGNASIDSLLNPPARISPASGKLSPVASPEGYSPGSLPSRSKGSGGQSFSSVGGQAAMASSHDSLNVPVGEFSELILLEVFWPGWPADLCEPSLMDHLIEVFYNHVPSMPRMIHRERFLARMANPPTHSSFPPAVLLHSICAVGSLYSPRVFVDPDFKPGSILNGEADDPRKIADFGERHVAIARKLLERKTDDIRIIYAQAQSMQILGHFYHFKAQWLDAWSVSGMSSRQVGPLGLHVDLERIGNFGYGPGNSMAALLPPPVDQIEREERRALLWMIVGTDVSASTGSGWLSSLALDEIAIPLCCAVEDFETNVGEGRNDQTTGSPDFYCRHPIEDSFVMVTKAAVLLGQAGKVLRKAKISGALDAQMGELARLEDLRRQFLTTFPRSLRDPLTPSKGRLKKAIDTDLYAAHVLLHQIAIALHEPLADITDPANTSTQTLLAGARGIMNLVYLAISTNFDMSYLIRCFTGFFTAARILYIFFDHAMHRGGGFCAAGSAADIKVELEIIRMVFDAQADRFPLGVRYARMVDVLLSNAPMRWAPKAESSALAIWCHHAAPDQELPNVER